VILITVGCDQYQYEVIDWSRGTGWMKIGGDHMSTFRRLSLIFALGVSIPMGLFLVPAHPASAWKSFAAARRFAEPVALPCSKQPWYDADRVCLTWTKPRSH
jgi:hypothetical protein